MYFSLKATQVPVKAKTYPKNERITVHHRTETLHFIIPHLIQLDKFTSIIYQITNTLDRMLYLFNVNEDDLNLMTLACTYVDL